MRKFISRSFALIMTAAMLVSLPGVAQAAEIAGENQTEETIVSEETEISTDGTVEETSEELSEDEKEFEESISEENIEEFVENDSEEETEENTEEISEEETTEEISEEELIDETSEEITEEEIIETEEDEVVSEEEVVGAKYEVYVGISETKEAKALSDKSAAMIMSLNGFETKSLSKSMIEDKVLLNAEALTALSGATADKDYTENEVVFFADSEKEAEDVAKCYNGTLLTFAEGIATMEIPCTVKEAVKVSANTNISIPAVFPQYKYHICGNTVTDPYYPEQTYHEEIGVPEAWATTQGSGVKVCIVDTGIDTTHEDLKVKACKSVIYDENGELIANGQDDNGHGTHCAGIVAAQMNGVGVVGVAPNVELYGVKVMDKFGSGYDADIARGVNVAADEYDVDIISMSLGGIIFDSFLQKTINDAAAKGIIVIAAAGNESTCQKSYPGACDNVLCVGATGYYHDDENGDTYCDYQMCADYSNAGKWVDVFAPGTGILSTITTTIGKYYDDFDEEYYPVEEYTYWEDDLGYCKLSGTSMATPVVAGVTALVLATTDIEDTGDLSYVNAVSNVIINNYENEVWNYDWDNGFKTPMVDAALAVYFGERENSVVVAKPTIRFFEQEPDEKNKVLTRVYKEKYNSEFDYHYGEFNTNFFTFDTETEGAQIVYTLDGSKPVHGVSDTDLYYNDIVNPTRWFEDTEWGEIESRDLKGKVKIRAIAYLGDKVSEEFSATYNFIVPAEGISMNSYDLTFKSGQSQQLQYEVYPDNATYKNVTFTLESPNKYVSVSKTGKVTVKKNAPETTEEEWIHATVKNGYGGGSSISFAIGFKIKNSFEGNLELNHDEITLTKDNYLAYNYETRYRIRKYYENLVADGKMSQDEYKKLQDENLYYCNVMPTINGEYFDNVKFTSSNKKVIKVDRWGYIETVGAGTAVITVNALDGSKRSAKMTVHVIDPIAFELYTSNDFYAYSDYDAPEYDDPDVPLPDDFDMDSFDYEFTPERFHSVTYDRYSWERASVSIGSGCSIKLDAKNEYWDDKKEQYVFAKISPKKFTWTVSDKSIKIKNGKLTVPKKVKPGTTFTVTATTKDIFKTSITMDFTVTDPIKSFDFFGIKNKLTYNMKVGQERINPVSNLNVNTLYDTDMYFYNFKTEVSGRDSAVSIYYLFSGEYLVACKEGTYKYTITARDGSNKKFVMTVKVK